MKVISATDFVNTGSFEQVVSSLMRLSHCLGCASDDLLQSKFHLGATQFKIVWVLKKNPAGVAQKTIAMWLSQTEAAISRQMKGMIEEGLIESQVVPENRRQNLVRLTKKGQAFAKQAILAIEHEQANMFQALTKKERMQVVDLLNRLFAAVVKKNKW